MFVLHNKMILIISFSIIVKQCFLFKVGLFVLHIFNVYRLGTVLCNHLLYLLLNVRYRLDTTKASVTKWLLTLFRQ